MDGEKYLVVGKADGTYCTAWCTFWFVHCHNLYKLWNIKIELTGKIFILARWDRDKPTLSLNRCWICLYCIRRHIGNHSITKPLQFWIHCWLMVLVMGSIWKQNWQCNPEENTRKKVWTGQSRFAILHTRLPLRIKKDLHCFIATQTVNLYSPSRMGMPALGWNCRPS